ncbi:glutathione S-transferase [Azospirillaceae bacterium]
MMKLCFSPASPYVRKVVMVAAEAGILDQIEKVPTDVWAPETVIHQSNPLGKVPTLVLEDGYALFDSPVICEYLASLAPEQGLLPPGGRERWRILRMQALADGVIDAAVARRLESLRPAEQRSAAWAERQRLTIERSCDVLEAVVNELQGSPNLGSLAVAAGLGYLDFRFPEDDWRRGRPCLQAWFRGFSTRESFRVSAPPSL